MNHEPAPPRAHPVAGELELSVIIPTYDRPDVLERTLRSLAASRGVDFRDLEVLVIDDGSPTEATQSLLDRIQAELPYTLHALHQPNAGQAQARNLAMPRCRGRIWLFLNDDAPVTPELLAGHLRSHADHPEESCGILGRVTLAPEIPASPARALHLDHVWKAIENRDHLAWHQFWTTNVSVKAAFLERHHLRFDPDIRYIHDDTEFGQRLFEQGFQLRYAPHAVAYHDHAITEADFLRMAEREAASLLHWSRKRPDRVHDLARFGFTPARKPWEKILKYPLLALGFNRITLPGWRWLSRVTWPLSPRLSCFFLSQCYASRKRRRIREGMRREARGR